jgi:hypothetical protein
VGHIRRHNVREYQPVALGRYQSQS